MKLKILLLAILGLGLAFKSGSEYSNLKIGAKAPLSDYKMMDTNGESWNLEKLNGESGLLVIFSCNTCPFVVGNAEKSEGWENRYNEIHNQAEQMGVNMVLINSNEAKRGDVDSMEEMVLHAKKKGYTARYLMDEGHKLADAFGAKTTPHVFLFDSNLELQYQGAIDDNVNSRKAVKFPYLQTALKYMSKGENIPVKETKPVGCSIKRVKTEK